MNLKTARATLRSQGLVPEISEWAAQQLSGAARRGDVDVVDAYLTIGFSPDCCGGLHESTPLVVTAAAENHSDLIQLLAARGADLNAFDLFKTALHKAVEAGHLEAARALLDADARTDLSCTNDWTPLSRAIKEKNRELVELLLEREAWTGGVPCAMVFALGVDDDWYLERLLEVPGQAEMVIDADSNKTPLMYAAVADDAARIGQILAAGAEVDKQNSFGWTARMMADYNDKQSAARALQEAGAAASDEHVLAAVRAASSGYVAALRAALDAGASPDVRNRLGQSLTLVAAGPGHDDIIRLLAERGADLNVPEESGRVNALAFALMRDQLPTADLLLELGADPKACAAASLNACVKKQRLDWLQRLLDLGADVNDADSLGQSPLSWASSKGFTDAAKLLIDRGADVDQTTTTGKRPVHSAILNGHEAVVELLLAAGAKTNCVDDSTMTPLRLAVQSLHRTGAEIYRRVFRRLVLAGADPNAPVLGLEPLHDDGALRNEVDAYQTKGAIRRVAQELDLLESPTCLEPEPVANSGKMPDDFYRTLAQKQNADSMAKLLGSVYSDFKHALLRVGVDWKAPPMRGLSPLTVAASNYDDETVKLLLAAGCDPNQTDHDGLTPLIAAARCGRTEIVRALVDAGADPNLRSRTVWDCWHEQGAVRNLDPHAPRERRRAHLEAKAWRRVTPDAPGQSAACESRGSFSPVQAAAARGHVEVLEELHRRGARLEVHETGPDALNDAIKSNQERSSIWLLKRGADPNRHVRGRSALFEAVERDMLRVVEALLERGADPNVALLDNGQTPLLLACSRGRTDILDRLLEGGADANHADRDGKTAFDWAASRGIRDHLLSSPLAKLSQKLRDWAQSFGVTRPAALITVPLAGVLGQIARREIGFTHSRSLPPSKEALAQAKGETDERGDTPLMAAVLLDDERLVKALLESGSDPNQVNENGDNAGTYSTLGVSDEVQQRINEHCKANPVQQIMLYDRIEKLEAAIKQGNLEAVQRRLTEKSNSLHLLRARHSPLRFAIARRDEKMVRLLLDLGVDPNAEASRAHLPLIEAAREGSDDAQVVRHLLDAGADPWRTEQEFTPLYYSVSEGNTAETKLLLAAMGELDWERQELKHVLLLARSSGRLDALEEMRRLGAPTG